MTLCQQCEQLNGELSSTPPHPHLVEQGSSNLSGAFYGQASGSVFFFKCSTCGATWGQDCDSKDPGASWYLTAPAQ